MLAIPLPGAVTIGAQVRVVAQMHPSIVYNHPFNGDGQIYSPLENEWLNVLSRSRPDIISLTLLPSSNGAGIAKR